VQGLLLRHGGGSTGGEKERQRGDNPCWRETSILPAVITRFVLMHTSHAGNVGAAARALKVMGFDDLVLVQPRWGDVLQRDEALALASGAADVLGRARVVESLAEALEGVSHVAATAMTPRDFGPPTAAPREHFAALAAAAGGPPSTAFVFGGERFGLSNEDVYRCNVCLSIPTAPGYGSLNLAQAVQLIAYEWRLALGGFAVEARAPVPQTRRPCRVCSSIGARCWCRSATSIRRRRRS
jgi:tRNA/rRNA methyltransferase